MVERIQYSEKQMEALDLNIRRFLYSLIQEAPGLHFRELQRRTKTATGQLTYHLDYLQKVDLIKTNRSGEFLRFYPSNLNDERIAILKLVRQKSMRHLVLYLSEKNNCNCEQLVGALHLAPSTISWHLGKLIHSKIVEKKSENKTSVFSIACPQLVKQVLLEYQESFMDKLVDQFIEMWEL